MYGYIYLIYKVYICMYVCMYVNMYVFIYIFVCIYIYEFICVCLCIIYIFSIVHTLPTIYLFIYFAISNALRLPGRNRYFSDKAAYCTCFYTCILLLLFWVYNKEFIIIIIIIFNTCQ